MMFRGHRALAVARKEVTDIVRDRRTIFMAVVFPLVLYPLLIIGLIQAAFVQEKRAEKTIAHVGLTGGEFAPGLRNSLAEAEGLEVIDDPGTVEGRLRSRPDVSIAVPFDFKATIAEGKTATIILTYDSADEGSIGASERVIGVVNKFARYILVTRLEDNGLDEDFVNPVQINRKDIATPRKRGAFQIGKILAFLLVILCMMGALYPALDAVAGEKERGTLETLLSIPATRLEILAGKYIGVFGMSVTSVVANFVSLSVTMLMVNNLIESTANGEMTIDFSVPMRAFLIFIPALLPLAALFSAVSLGVASFARSTREGQYYLGPLYAAVLPLTAVSVVPGVRLSYLTSFVPVLSMALFLKEGLLETLEAGPAVVAVGSTCVYAVIALKWAAGVFSREDVLFSSPSAEGTARVGGGAAQPAHALFVWAVSVILFFFVGSRLQLLQLEDGIGMLPVTLVIQVCFIVGPALVYALLWRLDWRKVFCLGRLDGRRGVSVALYVPAAVLLGVGAKAVQEYFIEAPTTSTEAAGAAFQQTSFYAFFIAVAVLPAVCEELLYRGFIYRSLAGRVKPVWAIALTAMLFSLAHLNFYEVLPLFVLGVVLVLAARSTGGLIGAMVVHFCHNSFSLVVLLEQERLAFLERYFEGPYAWAVIAGLLVTGGGMLFAAVRLSPGRGESN